MNENAKAWVAALRSGEFQQGRHRLRDGDRYCCLGVACELYRARTGVGTWVNSGKSETRPYWTFEIEDSLRDGVSYPPQPVETWLGLASPLGSYGATMRHRTLTIDNDEGKTFPEIAWIIERHEKELFLGG